MVGLQKDVKCAQVVVIDSSKHTWDAQETEGWDVKREEVES